MKFLKILSVLAAICFGVKWGGIFVGELEYFRSAVSWLVIWTAIEFYAGEFDIRRN